MRCDHYIEAVNAHDVIIHCCCMAPPPLLNHLHDCVWHAINLQSRKRRSCPTVKVTAYGLAELLQLCYFLGREAFKDFWHERRR